MRSASPIQEFRDKPSKLYFSDKKRTCNHDDCSVKLSIYNLTDYCSLHEKQYAKITKFI